MYGIFLNRQHIATVKNWKLFFSKERHKIGLDYLEIIYLDTYVRIISREIANRNFFSSALIIQEQKFYSQINGICASKCFLKTIYKLLSLHFTARSSLRLAGSTNFSK